MSDNAKKANLQVPAKTNEPTQGDRDVVRAQIERDRKDPSPPKVKFVWHEEQSAYGWELEHPDLLTATLLLRSGNRRERGGFWPWTGEPNGVHCRNQRTLRHGRRLPLHGGRHELHGLDGQRVGAERRA